jgi:hypothetical protein
VEGIEMKLRVWQLGDSFKNKGKWDPEKNLVCESLGKSRKRRTLDLKLTVTHFWGSRTERGGNSKKFKRESPDGNYNLHQLCGRHIEMNFTIKPAKWSREEMGTGTQKEQKGESLGNGEKSLLGDQAKRWELETKRTGAGNCGERRKSTCALWKKYYAQEGKRGGQDEKNPDGKWRKLKRRRNSK